MRFGYLLLVCLVLAIGCAPPPTLRTPASPATSSSNDRSQHADANQTTDQKSDHAPRSNTSPADPRSTQEFDPIDSLITDAVPDISDSVAAATEARLTSFEEGIDFPVTINRRVLTWIDEYSGRSRKSFQNSLHRSGRYMQRIREIFREEGVPQDLAFIAHVESGFRYNARSHASAVGLWQFMAGTARDLGLRCDSEVDERLDPEKSTRAAARYLSNLHAKYNDWNLALAAYNAGPGNVDRAIRSCGSSDYWEISKRGALRTETCNFVPAILAASILSKSPADFGLVEETDRPFDSQTVEVDVPTDLRVVALCAGCEVEDLKTMNPALLKHRTPAGGYPVRVPAHLAERTREGLAAIPPEKRILFQEHRLKRGDTLGALARSYGTTVRAIQDANDMGKSTLLRVGGVLRIPAGGTTLNAALANSSSPPPAAGSWSGTHRVQRGETLHGIARKTGTTVALLAERNGLADPRKLKVGQILQVPSYGAPEPQDQAVQVVVAAPSTSTTKPSRSVASGFLVSDASAQDLAPPIPDGQTGVTVQSDSANAGQTSPIDPESLGRGPSLVHLVDEARAELAETPAEPVPATQSHRVQKGDTLWNIARRHHVSVSDLRRWNRLGSKSTIHPGQVLRLH